MKSHLVEMPLQIPIIIIIIIINYQSSSIEPIVYHELPTILGYSVLLCAIKFTKVSHSGDYYDNLM